MPMYTEEPENQTNIEEGGKETPNITSETVDMTSDTVDVEESRTIDVEETLSEEELEEKIKEEVGEGEEIVEEEGKEIKYKPPKPSLGREEAKLLKIRNKMNLYRPRFIRMNSWYLKRLEDVWRSPNRSLDNKIRLEKKGYPAKVKVGYRGPKAVRGMHPSGFREVLVYNASQLEGLDPSKYAIRISSTVGRRKRGEIIKKAMELGLRILNLGGAGYE